MQGLALHFFLLKRVIIFVIINVSIKDKGCFYGKIQIKNKL